MTTTYTELVMRCDGCGRVHTILLTPGSVVDFSVDTETPNYTYICDECCKLRYQRPGGT